MSDENESRRRLDERARQLGLPTDPAAYQDGGLAVAATTFTLQDAELLAIVLKGEGIPAWVDGPNVAAWGWGAQPAFNPGGIRVVVPRGRLEDAKRVLETKGHQP